MANLERLESSLEITKAQMIIAWTLKVIPSLVIQQTISSLLTTTQLKHLEVLKVAVQVTLLFQETRLK